MCGAESAGRLVKVPELVVTETTTGTSPAPASDAGSSTTIWSKPGVSDRPTKCTGPATASAVPAMVVVPMVTETLLVVVTPRMPVSMIIRRVGTVSVSAVAQLPGVCEPFGTVVVTLNGSPGSATQGVVTVRAAARPPRPVG